MFLNFIMPKSDISLLATSIQSLFISQAFFFQFWISSFKFCNYYYTFFFLNTIKLLINLTRYFAADSLHVFPSNRRTITMKKPFSPPCTIPSNALHRSSFSHADISCSSVLFFASVCPIWNLGINSWNNSDTNWGEEFFMPPVGGKILAGHNSRWQYSWPRWPVTNWTSNL